MSVKTTSGVRAYIRSFFPGKVTAAEARKIRRHLGRGGISTAERTAVRAELRVHRDAFMPAARQLLAPLGHPPSPRHSPPPGGAVHKGTTDAVDPATALDPSEQGVLAELNAYRTSLGLPKLTLSASLTHAAEVHSNEMAASGVFSHSSPDGTSFSARVTRLAPAFHTWSENILWGDGDVSASSAMETWKGSPPHDANMRDPSVSSVGIARATSPDGKTYWTVDFAG